MRIAIDPRGFDDWPALLALLREAFAFMDGRIDPPSSLARLDADGLRAKARDEHLIVATEDDRLVGCVFAAPRAEALYVGKLAVVADRRGRGIARALLLAANAVARRHGLGTLELQTRVELVENHRTFAALGLRTVAETAHPGYDRPTSVTMHRAVRPLSIEVDDPARADVLALLAEHLRDMHAQSPPESVHALDVSRLKAPGITFWSVRDGGTLLGCGALKALDATHGEVKSMRTPAALRGLGAGRAMLDHLVDEARRRGWRRLSLETGSTPGFDPARRLYASAGFTGCGPFGEYAPDPFSVFMTRAL